MPRRQRCVLLIHLSLSLSCEKGRKATPPYVKRANEGIVEILFQGLTRSLRQLVSFAATEAFFRPRARSISTLKIGRRFVSPSPKMGISKYRVSPVTSCLKSNASRGDIEIFLDEIDKLWMISLPT